MQFSPNTAVVTVAMRALWLITSLANHFIHKLIKASGKVRKHVAVTSFRLHGVIWAWK